MQSRLLFTITAALLTLTTASEGACRPKEVYVYGATSTTYSYRDLDSGSGVATSASPDVILTVSNQASIALNATCTIGIPETKIASVAFGLNIGWTKTITVSYPLNWDEGVAFHAVLRERDVTKSGPCKIIEYKSTTTLKECRCDPLPDKNGTWTATKYDGTQCDHNP